MVVDVGKVVEDHPGAKGRVPCVVAERWNWRLLLARTLSLLESVIISLSLLPCTHGKVLAGIGLLNIVASPSL